MPPKNLNTICRYNKIKPVKYGNKIALRLRANPVQSSNDWSKSEFNGIKRLLRRAHYVKQKRRCAYCRRILNPLGINEHIDHIVARDVKYRWMFKPKNLILACYQCNTQKSKSNILTGTWVRNRLPKKSNNFVYFNPYYHIWHENFRIEDNLFLVAVTDVGEKTIEYLKLYDYKYSLVYAEESNIFNDTAIKRATKRMRNFNSNSVEYKSAQKMIDEIKKHI